LNTTLTLPEDVKEIITISPIGIPKLEERELFFMHMTQGLVGAVAVVG